MESAAIIFPILLLIFSTATIIDFICHLLSGNHILKGIFFRVVEIFVVLITPSCVLSTDIGTFNDCCTDSAVFSPQHRATIYFFIFVCVLTYFILSYRHNLFSPVLEVIFNSLILFGILFNIFIAVQFQEFMLWFFGNVPIIILFIYSLIKNNQLWKSSNVGSEKNCTNTIGKFCWRILNFNLFQKIPILLIVCLPVIIVAISFLMLFGQKPDSFIKAFTDTYKHGLSQLDCSNVICPGGHFLCTIAASGHSSFVKPIRKGVRHGNEIKVNRQLLISNAFEDLLQEKIPHFHKPVRWLYDRTGGNFAKLYVFISNKWISDVIYVAMKPLEWIFLFVLYVFDRNPENRIAKQYVQIEHRKHIDYLLTNRR